MKVTFWVFYSRFKKENSNVIKKAAEETGLSVNEISVLLFLANNPSADTAADIMRVRKAAKSHISLAVSQLTEKGCLTQQPGSGRKIHLKLTPSAEPLIAIGRKKQKQFLDRIFQDFSPSEKEVFLSCFAHIISNLQEEEDQHGDR